MLSEWCTVLLRNLSTVLQSGRSGTLLHLLPCPSNTSCIHALLRRGTGFLPWCNSSFWPYVRCGVLHSWQLTSLKLSTYKLINEIMPLCLGLFALNGCPVTFLSPCTTYLKASCLNQARPLLVPDKEVFKL